MVAVKWGRFVNQREDAIEDQGLLYRKIKKTAFRILNVKDNVLNGKNAAVSYGERHIVDPIIKETNAVIFDNFIRSLVNQSKVDVALANIIGCLSGLTSHRIPINYSVPTHFCVIG